MTAPTTGADETTSAECAHKRSLAHLSLYRCDDCGQTMYVHFAYSPHGARERIGHTPVVIVPAASVPDAELRAIAEWRSQHNDDMWELFDYIEAGIDEETDVAQRYVMRERFDELRALLESRHLAAGDAARTEEGG